jgi:hypothetical protein
MKRLVWMFLWVCGCGTSSNPAMTPDAMAGSADAMPDPADQILNGADRASTTTYWIKSGGVSLSDFAFAFFADGTGRYDNRDGRAAVSITWKKLGPTSIAVSGAQQLPSLTQIQGSVSSGTFAADVSGSLFNFSISGGTL